MKRNEKRFILRLSRHIHAPGCQSLFSALLNPFECTDLKTSFKLGAKKEIQTFFIWLAPAFAASFSPGMSFHKIIKMHKKNAQASSRSSTKQSYNFIEGLNSFISPESRWRLRNFTSAKKKRGKERNVSCVEVELENHVFGSRCCVCATARNRAFNATKFRTFMSTKR